MAGKIPKSFRKPPLGWGIRAVLVLFGILAVFVILLVSCHKRSPAISVQLWGVTFAPNSQSVIAYGGDSGVSRPPTPGELIFWDMATGKKHVLRQLGSVRSAAWSPDGKFVAIGDFAGLAKLVSLGENNVVQSLSPPSTAVNAVAISADGSLIAGATLDGTIDLWDNSGKEQHLFTAPNEKFLDVAISPDQSIMIGTTQSGKAIVFSLKDQGDPVTLQTSEGSATGDSAAECVAFAPDGLSFATGALRTLRIWETRTGAIKQEIVATARFYKVAFSPDGKTVATVLDDGRLALWNPETGQVINSIQAHPNEAFGLSFAPDGKRIATVSRNDFTIKIWDAVTLELKASLRTSNT